MAASGGRPGPDRRTLLRGGAAVLAGAGALAAAGCGSDAGGVAAAPIPAPDSSLDPYYPGHGAGGFLVNHCALDLDYEPATRHLGGTAGLRIMPYTDLSSVSFDLASNLRVASVAVNGGPARFTRSTDKVHITPAGPLSAAEMATVQIAYSGQPQPAPVRAVGRAGWQPAGAPAAPGSAGPLSLPIGAPTWYPCADHPTLKSAYQIAVTAPSDLTVLANGTLQGKTVSGGRTTWTYRHDGPMASYLTGVYIGDFVIETATGPNGVQLRNAYPERIAAAARQDLGRQAQMLDVFTSLFGTYPYEVFGTAALDGLPVSSAAAQTLSLLDATLIDGSGACEPQVAYNLGVQWFGASVSVASWADVWLTLGPATYAQWLWAEHSGGASADTAARAAMATLAGLPADLVLSDPGAYRLVDPRVPLRGACFLHALRLVMGDRTFFQLLTQWAAQTRGGFASTADFAQTVSNVYTLQSMDNFIAAWAYAAPLPAMPDPA